MKRHAGRLMMAGAVILWGLGVGAGLWTLWSYENGPGPSASAPAVWPPAPALTRPTGRCTRSAPVPAQPLPSSRASSRMFPILPTSAR